MSEVNISDITEVYRFYKRGVTKLSENGRYLYI